MIYDIPIEHEKKSFFESFVLRYLKKKKYQYQNSV